MWRGVDVDEVAPFCASNSLVHLAGHTGPSLRGGESCGVWTGAGTCGHAVPTRSQPRLMRLISAIRRQNLVL